MRFNLNILAVLATICWLQYLLGQFEDFINF